jgi:hypothetical protein
MTKLTREDLYSLEEYAEVRPQFRSDVMEHKKKRQVPVGPDATLYFEDAKTMKYQVQEMLRIERIFEKEGIQEELDAYNPLIPDGSNWKATFMVEIPDVAKRRERLAELIGVEDKVWVQVAGHDRVYAVADEDLERADKDKTSSVHFLRFELTPEMAASVKSGAAVGVGIEHDHYRAEIEALPPQVRDSLAEDLH